MGQQDSLRILRPYKVNHKIEVPITVVGLGAIMYGYSRLPARTTMTEEEVLALDPNDVNAFDRPVLDFPTSGYESAQNTSDALLNTMVFAPALLLLDKEIRGDWDDFLTLYFQSHLAGSILYQACAYTIERPRPLIYNEELSMELRTGHNSNNSFFSGHVSTTATSSFFMAKVYSDYHDLTSLQKVLIYTAAAIPPAAVGYYRIRAGKHFRTDVITGFVVGTLTGILVPEFHKRKDSGWSFVPVYSREMRGVALNLRF